MLRANHSCCALASTASPALSLCVPGDMPPATTEETDLVQELRALLSTERGGVRLSSVVIELLVTHYVQSVMVSDANEVEVQELVESQ